MYKSNTFAEVNFIESTRQLVKSITDTYQGTSTILDFKGNHVKLSINQAIPCSLIINEVITNILKHAFAGKTLGAISISLEQEGSLLSLGIRDNGTAYNGNLKELQTKSLGLEIIRELASQLKANYFYTTTYEFNCFILEFAKDEIVTAC